MVFYWTHYVLHSFVENHIFKFFNHFVKLDFSTNASNYSRTDVNWIGAIEIENGDLFLLDFFLFLWVIHLLCEVV